MSLFQAWSRALAMSAVLLLCSKLNDAESLNPLMRIYCTDDDPFISSTPFGNKVFLHPWKTEERKGDWYYNRAYCAQHCAEMVTIHSSAENEIFHEFMRNVGMVHPGTWLGGQIRQKQEMRQWYDGVEVTFMKKAPGEFNEDGLTCLDAGWDNSQTWWRNWYCTGDVSNRHFVACQRQATSKNLSQDC